MGSKERIAERGAHSAQQGWASCDQYAGWVAMDSERGPELVLLGYNSQTRKVFLRADDGWIHAGLGKGYTSKDIWDLHEAYRLVFLVEIVDSRSSGKRVAAQANPNLGFTLVLPLLLVACLEDRGEGKGTPP